MIKKFAHWFANTMEAADNGMAKVESNTKKWAENAKIRKVENLIKLYHQGKSYHSNEENLEKLTDIVNAYDELNSPNKNFEREILNIRQEIKEST